MGQNPRIRNGRSSPLGSATNVADERTSERKATYETVCDGSEQKIMKHVQIAMKDHGRVHPIRMPTKRP